MRKRDRVIHWASTAAVSGVMAFSAINFNLPKAYGPFERPFEHLGLPDYLRVELSIAKALGVAALLVPGVPRKIKEFAYFGFAITLVSASVAHFATGDGAAFVIDPLLFLVALGVSYRGFSRGATLAEAAPRGPAAVPRHLEGTTHGPAREPARTPGARDARAG